MRDVNIIARDAALDMEPQVCRLRACSNCMDHLNPEQQNELFIMHEGADLPLLHA
jgi:hypothetical protein